MFRPSLASDCHFMPVIDLNFCAFCTAASMPLAGLPDSRALTRPVLRTRCGMPSTRVETTVSCSPLARYCCFTESGTSESLVSRNRVPIAMPDAP